jgi:hypothetical protein
MAVSAEAITEYPARIASFRGSEYFSKLSHPAALHDLPPLEDAPPLLHPLKDFIRTRTEQIALENAPTPEQEILKLGAKRGSERWGMVEAINRRTGFIEKFAKTRNLLEQNFARFKVAAHELGHARVVNYLGGKVEQISIVPKGAVLGFTRYMLPSVRNVIDFVSYRIACAAGSRLAEEKIGEHDHSGCGGDNGQINSFAALGERLTGLRKSWFIIEGGKIASRAMSGYSRGDLHQDSMGLLDKDPVAA